MTNFKKKAFTPLLLLLTICFGCRNETIDSTVPKLKETTVVATNINENFDDFLKKFNQDSVFQMSRIVFPLKITTLNDDFEPIQETIDKKEYVTMDFTYPKEAQTRELDRYTQKTKEAKDTAVIEIRGIDNGILTDIIFEKKNGKWHLKTWNDQST
ncbi:DUF4348 domain-containing protein [Flavobacterium sp. GCM10023249]|uniref:DUF4348 domain-containing protein n=1 Tax=unclassified Flavobacterium TaxID=196869 RepID=UPI003618E64A